MTLLFNSNAFVRGKKTAFARLILDIGYRWSSSSLIIESDTVYYTSAVYASVVRTFCWCNLAIELANLISKSGTFQIFYLHRWTQPIITRSGAAGRSAAHGPCWMTAAVARSAPPAEGSTATARCPACTGWSADRGYSASSTRMRTITGTSTASAKTASLEPMELSAARRATAKVAYVTGRQALASHSSSLPKSPASSGVSRKQGRRWAQERSRARTSMRTDPALRRGWILADKSWTCRLIQVQM